MLTQTLRFARPSLRTLPTPARALHSTPARRAPGLAQGSGQSVGEDGADTARKNAMVPLFMAAGAAIAGYIAYSQISAGQAAREEKKGAKTDQQKENIPAGSKERTGARG